MPFLIHVNTITTIVETAGAIVVVAKIDARLVFDVAAAPLNPYQPNQRMKQPKAPRVMLCPRIGFGFPFSSNLPILGPNILAPMSAETPPTVWIHAEPAKSMKPFSANQPPPHTQWASIGYTIRLITKLYTQ